MVRRFVAVVVMLAASLGIAAVESATPAMACGEGSSGACTSAGGSSANTGYYSLPGTSCGAYVSSSGMGGMCAAPGQVESGGDPPSWKDLIGDRTFHPCRYDRMHDGFQTPPPKDDDPNKEWLIRTCMTNYDVTQPQGGGEVEVVITRVWREYEEPDWWMEVIWGDVSRSQSTFPFAFLDYGPQRPEPVVGTPTYFWTEFSTLDDDGSPEPVGDLPYEVPIGSDMESGEPVYLLARLGKLEIDTGEEDPETGEPIVIDCGKQWHNEFTEEDELDSFDSRCTHTYEHSSAGEPDERYSVNAVATWHIFWKEGQNGPPQALDSSGNTVVTTEMEHEIRVREVQVRDSRLTR